MTHPRIYSDSQVLAQRLQDLAATIEANEPVEYTWSSSVGRHSEVGPPRSRRVDISITWPLP